MLVLLALLVPFFGLILLGWGAARARLLPLEGIGAMMVFVLYFALSALLFRLGAGGSLQSGASWHLLAVYAGAALVVMALGLGLGARAGLNRRDSAVAAMVAVFPNTGFLGLPLLTGLLGHAAVGPVAATLLVDVILSLSLCMAWAHSVPGMRGGALGRDILQSSFKGATRNPLLWAMAAGLLVSALNWTVPRPVDDMLAMLGRAATPAALFTLGAILARSQMAVGRAVSAPVPGRVLLALSGVKLLVQPALVAGLGTLAMRAGWAVSPMGLTAITLAAALPSAANVSMVAEREGANVALVARVILWTTGAAIVTLLGWSAWLGVSGAAHP